jgi:hypothetical protein
MAKKYEDGRLCHKHEKWKFVKNENFSQLISEEILAIIKYIVERTMLLAGYNFTADSENVIYEKPKNTTQ